MSWRITGLSNLRRVVLVQLAKGAGLGLGIPASRLIRIFNLNGGLTYRFLRELESEEVAMQVSRNVWTLKDTHKARALAELALSDWRGLYSYFPETVPDVYYYMPDIPTTWFGGMAYRVVIADPVLEGRINPPGEYKVVYTSLRSRRFRFNWSLMMPVGGREQSIADLLSYDPLWPVEQYIVWYYGDIDLDEVARRCSPYGLKRLASFLSFMKMSLGVPKAMEFNYLTLLDRDVYEEFLPKYFSWVFANGVDITRNI
ncbi:MAG: hypothetical protein QW369_04480 [Desulfurococcaceae archaeon]